MTDNYEMIVGRISESAGLGRDEVERKIEAKRAKLSGLISKEGAAQVIAAELGVNFDDVRLKINELMSGMRRANFVGKIIRIFPVRTFTRDGQENKVANLVVADDTSNVKVVLWDTNHISLIEKNEISENSVVEISNGSVRGNEVHLGSFSELKSSSEEFAEVKTEIVVKEKSIVDFNVSDNVSVRAFIVQSFEPRFFEACPECGRKAVPGAEGTTCQQHGKVAAEKRGILNIVIDDGTETTRAVLFGDLIKSLGFTDLENPETAQRDRERMLGREMFFSGNVRNNSYFNNKEIIIDKIVEINPDELLRKLENAH